MATLSLELVAMIASHLGSATVCRLQRVSRTWHVAFTSDLVIATSLASWGCQANLLPLVSH